MKYNVIYADPPYSYKNKYTGCYGHKHYRGISGSISKYPTLSLTDLMQLPIQNICEKDCILFLWITAPLVGEGIELLKIWGFSYKGLIVWEKIGSWGMGFWFRNQCELLLFGIKGKVKPFNVQHTNIYQHKRNKHSEKPEYFRGLIEMATENIPNRKMIELFARKKAPCWDSTGFDSDGMDIREFLATGNTVLGLEKI